MKTKKTFSLILHMVISGLFTTVLRNELRNELRNSVRLISQTTLRLSARLPLEKLKVESLILTVVVHL